MKKRIIIQDEKSFGPGRRMRIVPKRKTSEVGYHGKEGRKKSPKLRGTARQSEKLRVPAKIQARKSEEERDLWGKRNQGGR